ncbi:sugar phosphate isomerase/epimerase [Akkermansiaceae bacterium]|nr:sugar phosphate isomerase/epimerase [Akkermansiaceae bacterium]
MKRREFIAGSMTLAALNSCSKKVAEEQKKLLLGYDNFAVRAMGWKAKALIDHAVKLKVDTLFITDFDAFESLEEDHLKEVKGYADEKGIKLYLGTWSICPTSTSFKDQWGTADEHLQLGLRSAKALGSPVIRVVLGKGADRQTLGGIEARIDDTVKVLKRNRSLAMDLGVKIAMENHAGDLHSLELKKLVEMAGPEFVGVNLDSGNAVWTLETPLENLENLGEYVLTTSLRDSQVWESANGVTVQWTAMGEGMVDWKAYFKRYAELCPNAPVQIETISGFNKELAFKDESFWRQWPGGKPATLDAFKKWAAAGKPQAPFQGESKEENQAYQLGEIGRSITFCKTLGLGRKG